MASSLVVTNDQKNIIAVARAIAVSTLGDQTDKSGHAYISHVARVATRVKRHGEYAVAAAWLHSTMERSDLAAEALVSARIPALVVNTVSALTLRSGTPTAAYFDRVRDSRLARLVKLADIADNMDPRRLALLDPTTQVRLIKRYSLALKRLDGLPKSV